MKRASVGVMSHDVMLRASFLSNFPGTIYCPWLQYRIAIIIIVRFSAIYHYELSVNFKKRCDIFGVFLHNYAVLYNIMQQVLHYVRENFMWAIMLQTWQRNSKMTHNVAKNWLGYYFSPFWIALSTIRDDICVRAMRYLWRVTY